MSHVYDIYHDESREDGYWHGFLFVPRRTRPDLLALLREARDIAGHRSAIHYVKLGRRDTARHGKAVIIKAWTSIGCNSLQQQKLNTFPPKIYLGNYSRKPRRAEYRVLDRLIRCRFVLFRERDSHAKMFSGLSPLESIETTFRMGIKGGAHKLFGNDDPLTIGNVFMDGDKHYIGKFGRTFDVDRTLQQFAVESRPYVSFDTVPRLIPQRSDHEEIESHQSKDDSFLLQMCDILIGGCRFHVLNGDRTHVRYDVSAPCRDLLQHEQGNYARMKNSRYFRGFSLSDAWLEGGKWQFAPFRPKQPAIKAQQGDLL